MAGLDEQNGISKNFNEKSPVLLNPAQESLNKILTADKNQFVILGDTDHTNKNIIGFLAKEQTMAVLAQNGIKNLALEVRKEFQPLADKVSKGELSPRDYAEEKSRMYARQGDNSLDAKSLKSVMEGHIFRMAGKYGIKVLCVEGQAPTLKTHGEMVDRLDESNAAVAKRAAELTGIGQSLGSFAKEKISDWTNGKIAAEAKTERGVLSLSNYMKATDPQTISIKQQDKRVLEARAAGDVGLAKMITDQVKGEKTAVFYGTGHGAQNYDLDEILNARKINLHSDMNDVKLMNQSDFMRNNQSADFSIAINTGQTVTRQEADRMLIKSEPQLQKDFLPTTQKKP